MSTSLWTRWNGDYFCGTTYGTFYCIFFVCTFTVILAGCYFSSTYHQEQPPPPFLHYVVYHFPAFPNRCIWVCFIWMQASFPSAIFYPPGLNLAKTYNFSNGLVQVNRLPFKISRVRANTGPAVGGGVLSNVMSSNLLFSTGRNSTL